MSTTAVFISDTALRVTEDGTGRSETVLIPTRDALGRLVYSREELEDLTHWARESVERGWKKQDAKPQIKLTKFQQHDLGGVLLDIRESRNRRRETHHGRYF
jgi:hypothetical protein